MGNFHANELEMRKRAEDGKKDTAFDHLLYFFQNQRNGHIELANEHIRKAEVLCDADMDVVIRSQICIMKWIRA